MRYGWSFRLSAGFAVAVVITACADRPGEEGGMAGFGRHSHPDVMFTPRNAPPMSEMNAMRRL